MFVRLNYFFQIQLKKIQLEQQIKGPYIVFTFQAVKALSPFIDVNMQQLIAYASYLKLSINNFYMRSYKFLPREPHRSPQFIRTSRNNFNLQQSPNKFVPFAQERDRMGRLIKKQEEVEKKVDNLVLEKQCSHDLMSTQLSHRYEESPGKQDHISENITRQFQYKSSHQIRLYDRNKVKIRKNSLCFPSRKNTEEELFLPTLQPQNEHYLELKSLRKGSVAIPQNQIDSPLLRRSCSFAQAEVKYCRKFSINVQEDTPHEVICNKTNGKAIKDLANDRKSKVLLEKIQEKISEPNLVLPQSYIKSKIEKRQIVELNRYNTFKTLSLKMIDHLDQGHNLFVQKMRQTKKLAYQIRMNLQST